jgi:hypothetical protein
MKTFNRPKFNSRSGTRNNRVEYQVKPNVLFKNKINEVSYVGDIINEEEIEGKGYYVVKINGRVQKLAKEGFVITRNIK